MPCQISELETALRHIGCHETLLPSFLQVSSTETVQDSQEWLIVLAFVGLIFAGLIVGGFAFWFSVYDSGKSFRVDFQEAVDSRKEKQALRKNYVQAKKASQATRLFSSSTVGSDFVVKGTLTTAPQDCLIEVSDEEDRGLLRALVCETGPHPGILLEDALNGSPLVFIDSSLAVNRKSSCLKPPSLEIQKLGEDDGIFGSIKEEASGGVRQLVIRNASHKTLICLQPDSYGRSLNAVDDRSRLVGTAQQQEGNWKVILGPGVDPGVMICGLLGIAKLGGLVQPANRTFSR